MTKKEIIEALFNQMKEDKQFEDFEDGVGNLAKLLRTTIDEFKKQNISEEVAIQVFIEIMRGVAYDS